MKRATTNFAVDALALAAFVFLTATGLVERYLLPPGSGRFQSLWGMTRHQWGEIHFWIAVVLMGTLTIHILLHWKWIVCIVRGRPSNASGWRVALGVVGLIGLAGLSAAPFLATVEETGERGRRRHLQFDVAAGVNGEHATNPVDVRGSMTLAEVEQSTGVAAAVIIRELGLPTDLPRDVNIGQLRRRYGFEIRDVRRIIEEQTPRIR